MPLTHPYRVGDRVVAHRARPAAGTWSRYAGRTGTVVQVNRPDREAGVVLGAPIKLKLGGHNRVVWFTYDELVLADAVHRPRARPGVRSDAPAATPVP